MSNCKIDYSIVLAAGKGTRFHSKLPKVLHKLSGKTLLERSINAVAPFTAKEIIIVAGHGFDLVTEEISKITAANPSYKIRVVLQKEQLGTGHAAKTAFDEIEDKGSVIIIPGDCPLIEAKSLEKFIEQENKSPVSVLSLEVDTPKGFGRILRNQQNKFIGIVEEKDATDEQRKITEINSSIFLGQIELFKKYIPLISNSNKQNEYYLTDVVSAVVKDDQEVRAFASNEVESFLGANSRRELYALQEAKRLKNLNALMDRGVTLESINSCFIDDGVEIGQDVYIGANTRIVGNSKIADGVTIEGDSLIRNSEIGENTHLKLGAYIDECRIEKNCNLGPFVHIRPKSVLKNNVKIGNFVEVKAATLEEGVKANHLTYLGDIDVGEGSNIGAGTIICNYDGKNKFRSKIGEKSFVGSNSTLISPVNVGDEAYVGAGSVINQDVPAGSLAIGRSRQVNKTGWSKSKK